MNIELILLQFGLIPVALLIGVGWWINSRGYPEPVLRRYLLILALAAGVLLLGVVGISAWLSRGGRGFAIPVEALLAPALLAVLALALVSLRGLAGAPRKEQVLISLLGLALIGLLYGLRNDGLGYTSFVVLGSLILAIVWKVGWRSAAVAIGLSIVALVLLGLYYRRVAIGYPLSGSQWLQTAYSILGFVPILVVALSALLFTLGIQRLPAIQVEPPKSTIRAWLPAFLRIGLAILLVASLAYIILWGSIWDQTHDGMYGIFLSIFCSLVSIGAGVLMVFTLSGRQRLASLIFLIVVPVLLFQGFNLGWRISNLEVTAGRAARIQRAVEHFYEREYSYPTVLDELTPRDLLWTPGPVILQGEGWCYQGGKHYYRLGAFYRDFFSSPLSLKIYARAGLPPEAVWECEARLPEMKARYDPPQ